MAGIRCAPRRKPSKRDRCLQQTLSEHEVTRYPMHAQCRKLQHCYPTVFLSHTVCVYIYLSLSRWASTTARALLP